MLLRLHYIPAIRELSPHVFEISIAHVVDAEDVQIRVFGDAFAHVGVELQRQFFAFSRGLGEVHDFGALGFRHCGWDGWLSLW